LQKPPAYAWDQILLALFLLIAGEHVCWICWNLYPSPVTQLHSFETAHIFNLCLNTKIVNLTHFLSKLVEVLAITLCYKRMCFDCKGSWALHLPMEYFHRVHFILEVCLRKRERVGLDFAVRIYIYIYMRIYIYLDVYMVHI